MLTVGIVTSETTSSAQLAAAAQQTGLVESMQEWVIPGSVVPDSAAMVPDVVLLDLARDTERFFSFASHMRRIRPTAKLVAVSAASPPTQSLLLEAMRSGVQEFLSKPIQLDELKTMLSRFAEEVVAAERPSLNK